MSSRLFCVGIGGPRLTNPERAALKAHPPYGVILFRRNLVELAESQALIRELKELGSPFLFVDQEGGPVDRLAGLLAPTPSFQAAARGGAARRLGDVSGAALNVLGFDVDLAPVVDRGAEGAGDLVLGERCASADPHAVLLAGGEFLTGLHGRGIGGCLKHFPGLGSAVASTDDRAVTIARGAAFLTARLAPFRAAIAAGTKLVMVSNAS